jgi:hypothetical protein
MSMIPRAPASQEAAWRRRLARLVSEEAFARGTLAWRERVCGKPACRCARGERHRGLYLVYREGGRTRQAYVPPAWHERVQEWVEHYREVKDLLDCVSQAQYRRLRERKAP